MKLAITNENELKSLSNLCNEIETFYKELQYRNYSDIDLERDKEFFKILYPIWKKAENIEEFMTGVFEQFHHIHHMRIVWNCSTLLDNCADLSLDHLDFNPKIKAGFEALDLLVEIDNYLENSVIGGIILNGLKHQSIKELLAKVPVDEPEGDQSKQTSQSKS